MGPYVGLSGQQSIVVSDDDSALTTGSGDVPTLATPRVVALAEAAAIAALDGHLEEGQTSVGTQVSLRHRAPSPVGRRVEAIAALTEVDGRTLRFNVTVRDGDRTVAEGLIERVVVDRDWFLRRA
jgi:fluoroacetyl-CoA thioesterase